MNIMVYILIAILLSLMFKIVSLERQNYSLKELNDKLIEFEEILDDEIRRVQGG